jgi:hypothetical protein
MEQRKRCGRKKDSFAESKKMMQQQKAQSRAQNNNQPDHNGGHLTCGGTQLLAECGGGPSKSTIVNILEVAEVVKNGNTMIVGSVCSKKKKCS